MKMQLKTPILEATQFKKGMETGWATRSELDSTLALVGRGRGIDNNSSYKKFPLNEYDNAEELAKAVHRKKDAVPYWDFKGFMVIKPKHNSFYWIEDGGLTRGSLKDIKVLYTIL